MVHKKALKSSSLKMFNSRNKRRWRSRINIPQMNHTQPNNTQPNHTGGFPYNIQTMMQPQMFSKKKNTSFFKDPIQYINSHIMYLNNSKFFAGVVMILLNIGAKFISVQFSRSTEEYLKYTLSKQVLVFAMAWMASRDIYTALILTAVFVILSEHLFNEESTFCVIPDKHRILNKLDEAADTKNPEKVTEAELNSAIAILEKAKIEKQKQVQHDLRMKYDEYSNSESKEDDSNEEGNNETETDSDYVVQNNE